MPLVVFLWFKVSKLLYEVNRSCRQTSPMYGTMFPGILKTFAIKTCEAKSNVDILYSSKMGFATDHSLFFNELFATHSV